MSQLDEVLALAANNTAGEFSISGDSLAVLFYALDFAQSLDNWRDYPDEELSETDIDEIKALVDGAIDQLMRPIMAAPIGGLMAFGGASAPDKWLLCDGSEISRTTYADLFAIIGVAYGAGNGTTTFNLPDMRGRSTMGADGSLVSGLGTQAGAAAVALSINNLPSHDHDYADPGHTHGLTSPFTSIIGARPAGGAAAAAGSTISGGAAIASNITGITFHAQGGNIPHANLHPVLGVNYIIYAGV
jgi:microcystin-dependent protein